MVLEKFSCLSCTSTQNTDSEEDKSPKLTHISKITDAAPSTSKFNQISPDKISRKSTDSIIIGTVGPIQPIGAREPSQKSNPSPISPPIERIAPLPKNYTDSPRYPKTRVDLEQLHIEMKRMNSELQELIEKREAENENIKSTLAGFKTQVDGLKSWSEIRKTMQFPLSEGVTQLTQNLTTDDYKTIFWKFGATCLMIHLCISHVCAKILPKLPGVFDFLFSVFTYSHLFLTSGILWMKHNSQNVSSDIIYDYQEYSQQIGATLCAGTLILLKCWQRGLLGGQVQMALTIFSYFLELWTPKHLLHFTHKILLALQITNIMLWMI